MNLKGEKPVKSAKSNYIAKFADGYSIPEQAIIFAGISMRLQKKLSGRKLDAFAELFRQSKAFYKYAYLGDALQRFNSAATYLVERIKEGLTLKDVRDCDPKLFLREKKQDGNAWCESHEIKFNPNNDRKVIIRDSDTIISKNFDDNLKITTDLYLSPANQDFIQSVDETVKQYMRRNEITAQTSSSVDLHFSPLSDDDPIDLCVKNFIARKLASLSLLKENTNYLRNPVYQILLKLSYCYVLYELAGFKTALQKIIEDLKLPSQFALPIYFLYPGKLDIVTNYFQLLQGFNVIAKEIKYKSVPPTSSEKILIPTIPASSGAFNTAESPMEESSSGDSPPSQSEILMVLAANLIANQAAGKSFTYQDQVRTIRSLSNRHLFTSNIGILTNCDDDNPSPQSEELTEEDAPSHFALGNN